VIIGASSMKHLEENLAELEKGPLPEEVVRVINSGWEKQARYLEGSGVERMALSVRLKGLETAENC
jgi:hypothetical protein